ncbi:uncharacterized protein LOC123546714 [Mercenaria mercenaria]|uniref:uncharacterized protein LOC123546714 n=1 Tax=Mercenaria mercenaria TaxID=6596 RepID=UPI00234E5C59|nr:uncharacterized protein LOC123546714 [Mercenaria mercenaria]
MDMTSENDSNNSEKMHEHVVTGVQQKRSLKRKETARRNLVDSIYTRQWDVRYSAPCLLGERMKPEIKFPRLNSKERSVRGMGYVNIHSNSENKKSQYKPTISPNSYIEIADESGRTDSISRNGTYGYTRKSSNQNISLPEIIMEFNLETSVAVNHNGVRMTSPSTDCHDEDRALGAPYEELLNQTKYNKFNPCRSRYRPVTPGLLESLNKLKVPTKVKTEQWIRSSQRTQKSQQGHVYKTENIDTTANWIYDD